MQLSKKYFPFSPGIPWTINDGHYIVPEIDMPVWENFVKPKNIIITSYLGFLEAFFSFSYIEAMLRVFPELHIEHMLDQEFQKLTGIINLSKNSEYQLDAETLSKYPVPIFFDQDNNAYYNVNNNYLITYSYKSNSKCFENKNPCLMQIYENCMIPWDNQIPQLRNINEKKVSDFLKSKDLHKNSKYILIFPETYNTIHGIDCLEWDDRQIRELSELLIHKGIKLISFERPKYNPYYHAGSVIRANFDIDIMLGLMRNSIAILSKDIDFLLIQMCINSECIIFSNTNTEQKSYYSLYANCEFLNASNTIITDNINPVNILEFLENL